MRKKDTHIIINNYSNHAELMYIPSILNDLKNKVKISNAILKINIKAYNSQNDKFGVYFVGENNEYIIDEFTISQDQKYVYINVTDELQQWIFSTNSILMFKVNGLSLFDTGNEVIFDYDSIKSFFEEKSIQNFDLGKAGSFNLDLNSGTSNLTHLDLSCFSNILPVNLNHIYDSINYNSTGDTVVLNSGSKKLGNYRCGKGWKTNFHQYLIKEKNAELFDDNETAKKITYIDGQGNHIVFKEKYYYIKDKQKNYVHPADVSIDSTNKLKISVDNITYEVYQEAHYKNLSLSGEIEDFKNLEYVQREINEIDSLKEEIKNIEKTMIEYEYSISYNNSLLSALDDKEKINAYNSYIQELTLDNEKIDLNLQLSGIEDKKEYNEKQSSYNEILDEKAQYTIDGLIQEISKFSKTITDVENGISELENRLTGDSDDDYDINQNINSYRSQLEELIEKKEDRERAKKLLEDELKAKGDFDYINNKINFDSQCALWGTVKDEDGNITLSDGKITGILSNRKRIYDDSLILKSLSDGYNKADYQTQKDKIEYENGVLRDKLCEINVLLKKNQNQLEILEKQIPSYIICDESGNSLGFSKTSNDNLFRLTHVADIYNNVIVINYDDDKIKSIVDSKKTLITFYYDEEGYLEKVIDINSNFIMFEYKNDSTGNRTLLSKIIYQDETESEYYYNENDNLSYIINSRGYGCYLEYSNNRVIKIREITKFQEISNNNAIKIENGETIPNTNIKYIEKNSLFIEYYDYKCTILTDLLTNRSTSYLFDKYGKIVTVCNNKFENGSVVGNVEVASYDRSNDDNYFIIHSLPYSRNFLDGSFFEETNVSEYILGEDILCGNDVYLTSYIRDEGDGLTSDVFVLNSQKPYISKFVTQKSIDEIKNKKISDLILSGWAKADSAWVDRRCTSYNSVINIEKNDSDFFENIMFSNVDEYRSERRFELKAILRYVHGETNEEKIVEQYCSYDWMNTKWQYCAFPITINEILNYELASIEVCFDYSNNIGEAQFTNMELKIGNWEYYEKEKNGKIIYYENSDDNKKVSFEYQDGKMAKEIITVDSKEYINRYYYNDKGFLVKKITYDGLVDENVYNDNGEIVQSYTYHRDNPSSKVYKLNLNVDETGTVIQDNNEYKVKYKYKRYSDVIEQIIDDQGTKLNFGYNYDGSLLNSVSTSICGRNNYNKCTYNYDLLTDLSHNGYKFGFVYDGCGNVIKIKLNDDILCTISEESVNETQLQESGDEKSVIVGKIITKTLATGEKIVFHNDLDGKTNYIEYYENLNVTKPSLLKNCFDNFGNVTEINDEENDAKYTFTYNEQGEVESIEYNQEQKSIIFTNNKINDNIVSNQTIIDDAVMETRYIYSEGLNRYLEKIYLSNGSIVSQTLDDLNRIINISVNGKSRTFEYLQDGDSSTMLVTDEWYSEVVDDVDVRKENLNYKYDNKGNIIEIRENKHLKAKYEYDLVSRLIREDNYDFNETYLNEYDVGGNIICRRTLPLTKEKTCEINDGILDDFSYKNNGWKDQLVSYNGEFFKYDSMGNPIIYRNNILKWSKGSLLDSYTDVVKNQTYMYKYNFEGVRTSKQIGNHIINFYLDGNRIVAQDGGNYLYFHYGVDGVIGFTYQGVGDYFYKKNIQGDIIGIYDSQGIQIVRYEYDAWGNQKIKVLKSQTFVDVGELSSIDDTISNYILVANLNPFRYRGYYYDSETNLYYCNSRYYSPEICRWISPDSLEYLDPEKINGLNLYLYCQNNPVMCLDVSGHSPEWWQWTLSGLSLVAGVACCFIPGGQVFGAGLIVAGASGLISNTMDAIGLDGKTASLISSGLSIVSGIALCFTPFAGIGAGLIGQGIGGIAGGYISEYLGGSFELGAAIGGIIGSFAGGFAYREIMSYKLSHMTAYEKGVMGEKYVKALYGNKVFKPTTGANRPDLLFRNGSKLIEVKNVASQGLTGQLNRYLNMGYGTNVIYVRLGTKVSSALKASSYVIKYLPW